MGFRKFASSAFDWAKDVPNKAMNAGMGHVDSRAVLDKIQDTTQYAQTRLLERSITKGENAGMRSRSPLHRGARSLNSLSKNISTSDIDLVAKNAIGSATAGAITGAAGGMASEDQSVIGGAIWGAGIGVLGGGGLTAKRIHDKKTAGGKAIESASRLRQMRRSKTALSDIPEKMSWSETLKGNGSIGETWRHNRMVNSKVKGRAGELGKLNAGIDAEYKKLNSLNSTRKGPVSGMNAWTMGGVAGAMTLAHSTLTANQPLPY